MKGTTWVQMIKAVLLVSAARRIMAVLVLFGQGVQPVRRAARRARLRRSTRPWATGRTCCKPDGRSTAPPTGRSCRSCRCPSPSSPGPSGLPHVLMRFYTVPHRQGGPPLGRVGDRPRRRVLPDDAGARHGRGLPRGPEGDPGGPGWRQRRRPAPGADAGWRGVHGRHLGHRLRHHPRGGGRASRSRPSASFAHDVYNSILKDGKADPEQEVRVARITSVVIGVLAILGGIVGQRPEHRVPDLAGLRGGGLGQPAVDPLHAVLAQVHHPRLGVVIYTGLISSVVLIVFSPAVSGRKTVDARRGRGLRLVPAGPTRRSSRSRWPSWPAGSARSRRRCEATRSSRSRWRCAP